MVFNLRNKIIEIQNGNKDNIYDILIIFDNILNKYSRLLDNEDTKQDLIIFLIGLFDKIPIYKFNNERQILSYISKSIKYEYIRLSKINSILTLSIFSALSLTSIYNTCFPSSFIS